MARVTRVVALLSVTIGATFFLVAGALGMGLTERFVFAIGVIVANVPEGLLPTVTLSLALATQRMARRNAIVRRLSSVETLGAHDGDLHRQDRHADRERDDRPARLDRRAPSSRSRAPATRPRAAARGREQSAPTVEELARAAALCNDATLERAGRRLAGDRRPDGGRAAHARAQGRARPRRARAHRLPAARRAAVRLRAQAHDHRARRRPAAPTAYVKGAPSAVIARTTLDGHDRARALAAADAMARDSPARARGRPARGRPTVPTPTRARARARAARAGRHARPAASRGRRRRRALPRAGIRVIMVTGDHGITAEAIAHRIGLIDGPARILRRRRASTRSTTPRSSRRSRRPDVLVARVTPGAEAAHRRGAARRRARSSR